LHSKCMQDELKVRLLHTTTMQKYKDDKPKDSSSRTDSSKWSS